MDVVEDADEVVVREVEEEVVAKMVRPAQSGCHLDSDGSWRQKGQQGHLQPVGLAKIPCQAEL